MSKKRIQKYAQYTLSLFLGCVCVLAVAGCEKRTDVVSSGSGEEAAQIPEVPFEVWTTRYADFIESVLAEYQSRLTQVRLVPRIVTFDSQQQMERALLEVAAENRSPDIVLSDAHWVYRDRKKFLPIPPESSLTPEKFRTTFVRSGSDLLVEGENVYGIPLSVETLALVYNDEHLINRLPDRNTPPTLWEEFSEDVRTLSLRDNSFERFTVAGAAIGRTDNTLRGEWLLENILSQMGARLQLPGGAAAVLSKANQMLPTGKEGNPAQAALNFFTGFADNRFRTYTWNEFLAGTDGMQDMQTFVNGKVSYVFALPEDVAWIREKAIEGKGQRNSTTIPDRNIRVGFLPQFFDPNTSPHVIHARVQALAVPKLSPHPEVAQDFALFAMRTSVQRSLYESTGIPAALVSLIAEYESDPLTGIFVRQAKFASAGQDTIPSWEKEEILDEAVEEIHRGEVSLEAAVSEIEEEVEEYVNERFKLRRILAPPSSP